MDTTITEQIAILKDRISNFDKFIKKSYHRTSKTRTKKNLERIDSVLDKLKSRFHYKFTLVSKTVKEQNDEASKMKDLTINEQMLLLKMRASKVNDLLYGKSIEIANVFYSIDQIYNAVKYSLKTGA